MQAVRIWWAKFCVRVPVFDRVIAAPIGRTIVRDQAFLGRRPHRSFQRTRRRDYKRSLTLPGYWSFTWFVAGTLYARRKTFLGLAIIYAVLSGLLVGLGSQDTFNQLTSLLKSTSLFGNWGDFGQATLLFGASVSGGISNPSPNSSQAVFGFLLVLMVWLTAVWLLRAQLAGQTPRLRDGLYNAGSPIIAMMLVMFFGLIQLLPLAIGVVVAGALMSFSGALAMLVWLLVSALVALSLYWVTSTFFALVIVTLPGMYPWQAIRTAGDLVIGRRVRILLRILWALLLTVVAWIVIMLPIILLDIGISSLWKPFAAVPVVPLVLLILATASLIWLSSYVYILYRRIVDDDAAPA